MSKASTPASTVVSVVEPSSRNRVDVAATAGATVPEATGLAMAAATLAVPVLTIVVAGLEAAGGLATALAATAAPATAATAGTAPATGFAMGKLPPARTAVGGRLGLTVMRAVSFGGAVLTMEVPVLLLGSGVEAGVEETGFNGALPRGGRPITSVGGVGDVAGVVPGTIGLTGLTGATAPGTTGLMGLTGTTGLMGLTGTPAAGPALAPGRTGAGGITGFAGETTTVAGVTEGGGPALGVPDGGFGLVGNCIC